MANTEDTGAGTPLLPPYGKVLVGLALLVAVLGLLVVLRPDRPTTLEEILRRDAASYYDDHAGGDATPGEVLVLADARVAGVAMTDRGGDITYVIFRPAEVGWTPVAIDDLASIEEIRRHAAPDMPPAGA